MATAKQLLANKNNARKSTGPKSAAGKLKSSQNAIKHGLCTEKFMVIGEKVDELDYVKDKFQKIIKKSKRTLVDPKVSLDRYRGAFILKPNLKEFEDYVGKTLTPKQLMSEAQRVRNELDIHHFIVTLGADGVLYVGDTIEHYAATAQEVFDVTGAGDTFTAALAFGIYNNLPVQDAVIIANKMSGLAVATSGTYAIQQNHFNEAMDEINEYINNRPQGLYREESLALL